MPESKDEFDRLCKRIDSYKDEMVAMQVELSAIPALGPTNGGEGEWKRARYLIEKLKAYGLTDITEYNADDDRVPEGTRPNMVVRLAGKSPRPMVWVMAHMDVVPPGEGWDTDPFQAVVRDGKIFARGVEDNQQGLVSALFAMRALVDEGIKPTTEVGLLLVSDEETGNVHGILHVLNKNPDLVGNDDIVLVPDSGNPDGSMVEVAEKSILWCELTTQGKQVHASMPHAGINAHRAGSNLMVRLDNALHSKYSKLEQVFDPPNSTFEPTKRDANVPNVNTIPGLDKFYLDCRVLPDYSLDDVLATIRDVAQEVEQQFKVQVKVETPVIAQAAPATPVDAPVVLAVSDAIREVLNVEPRPKGIGGGTVAAVFRHLGRNAVVWSTMDDLAHQPNEYCVIDNMVQDTKVFAHVFLRE